MIEQDQLLQIKPPLISRLLQKLLSIKGGFKRVKGMDVRMDQNISGMDMISKLPPCIIIEHILCLLPIQDAVRTSVLSNEWRYHWTKIPKLVFEEHTFQQPIYDDNFSALDETDNNLQSQWKGMSKRSKTFYAMNQVLLKHNGPIHDFTLSMETDFTCVDEVDHIMSYLSRNSTVKKLTLDIIGGYKLPLSIFLFDHLTDLYLHCCDLDHKPTFNGFRNLTSLIMDLTSTTKSSLLHLLSNCPLLKSLTMFSDDIRDIGDSTVTNLFESFSMVEDLSIWLSTIMCFVQDVVPRVLPTPLIHLKYLYVGHMNFAFKDGLPILLFLIRSSPNLEKLQIQIFDDLWVTESRERPSTLESLECYSDIWLERLNVLEISYFSNEKMELDLELDFMTFILAKSPVLKKVKICLWRDINEDDELHISRTLLSSQRASPMTEIIVERDNFDYGAV